MEEKINPLLLETTQQAFEKATREMMNKRGFNVDDYEGDYAECFKKVDGHYQDKATKDIYIIFLDGVSLGIDLTGRK